MRFSFFYILSIVVFGCTSSSILELDDTRTGGHYFPLQVGLFRVYDVVETNYSILETITKKYQLKESIVDSTTHLGGGLYYVVHRSTRMTATAEWQLDSVWTAKKDSRLAQLVENNIAFIKMVFPIKDQQEWDGNDNNIQNTAIYRYDLTVDDTTLHTIRYSQLVKVVQSNREDVFYKDVRYELFAPYVGLLIKTANVLSYVATEKQKEVGVKEIKDGRFIQITLQSHGKE